MAVRNVVLGWLPLWIIVVGMTAGAVTQEVNWLLLATVVALPMIFLQALSNQKATEAATEKEALRDTK